MIPLISASSMEKEEMCCGTCCWFYGEMTDGEGFCALRDPSINETRCDYLCAFELYISRKYMRHCRAVLLQAKRYTSDKHEPPIYRMPDPKELGKAIKFACTYIKVFSEL